MAQNNKTGYPILASTNNHPKHHAILVCGSNATSTAIVTLYDRNGGTGPTITLRVGVEQQVLPFQIKNTGAYSNCTLYGLA
jgi:hypothetical protein